MPGSRILYNTRLKIHYYYRPRSEVSEGYVFTGVCHSFCSTPGGWEEWTTPPPGQHLPPPNQGQMSQHLLPPWTTPPPLDNTSLPLDNTSHPLPRQHLPPPWTTPPSPQSHLPPSPPGLCTGGRYASYWNAFLLLRSFTRYPKNITSTCNSDKVLEHQ